MVVQEDVAFWPPASADRVAGIVPDQETTAPPVAESAELFESLVTEHWRLIYRIAFRLTGNQSEADDLAQDAVLEAFRAFRHFQPGTRFDRWLARIMTHTFIDHTRRRRGHAVVSLDEADTGEPADPAPGPEERASQHELNDRVQQALTGLAPEFRTAVVLVDLEGHSYEDASHIMGIPIGTVRSRLHRARHALRHTLEPVLVAS